MTFGYQPNAVYGNQMPCGCQNKTGAGWIAIALVIFLLLIICCCCCGANTGLGFNHCNTGCGCSNPCGGCNNNCGGGCGCNNPGII